MHQQLFYNPTLLAKGTVVAVGGAKAAPSLNNGHLDKSLNIMIYNIYNFIIFFITTTL